jgi:hypothetical protein
MNFKDKSLFEPQKLHRTPEGYLQGLIRATCAGVFRYLGEDGKTVDRVLRSEAEVGDPASVMSANSKPVTLRHPNENVTVENIAKYEVGFTGTDAYFDGIDLWITITITDKKAIEAIESGKVAAVSMGYDVASIEVNEDPLNNWRGTEYNKIQHGIRYNHLALVYAGRAGESVEITVGDSIDEIFNNHNNKTGDGASDPAKDSAMKKLIIDNAAYEVDEAVLAAFNGLQKQLKDNAEASKAELDKVTAARDELSKKLETVTAERDTAQAEAKTLKENQLDEEAIAKMVEEKIALVEAAKKYGCEVKAEDSALDIKKAVVAKAFGDKMDLTDKGADYVDVAFKSACIHLDGITGKPQNDASPFATNFSGVQETNIGDSEAAYKAMKDKLAGKAAKKEA